MTIHAIPLEEAERIERQTAVLAKIQRFEIIDLDDIDPGKEPPWLIDHMMPATGLAVVYGLPKCGKSFMIADAVFHVAWADVGRASVLRARLPIVLVRASLALSAAGGLPGAPWRRWQGRAIRPDTACPKLGPRGRRRSQDYRNTQDWLDADPPLRAIVIDTSAGPCAASTKTPQRTWASSSTTASASAASRLRRYRRAPCRQECRQRRQGVPSPFRPRRCHVVRRKRRGRKPGNNRDEGWRRRAFPGASAGAF